MIVRAPEPDVSIPDVALVPFLLASAEARGSTPALIDGPSGRTLTFEDWARGVRRVASGFARRGLRNGDVVAILSPNLPEYALAFHGVALCGGVNTTMNPLYTVGEVQSQLRDSGARYLVTVPPFLDKAREAAAGTQVGEIFVFATSEEAGDATPFGDLMAGDGAPLNVEIDPDTDLVALPYSSGTTGLPKGVMLSHRNLVANTLQSASVLNLGPGDVVLGVLPFFHIYGMVVIMNLALHKGATIVTLPRFDLEQCLDVLQRYRVTFANVVPPLVLALAKHPLVDKYNLGTLHTIFSGAAPLGEGLARAAHERLGCAVLQGYGLTETSPVTHATRHRDPNPKLAGIGPPIPSTESKIVDLETGRDLGPNREGEICIRGPQVMKGYLNRPDATAAMIDGDGWLHTGDIGYFDTDGCFFVVDRVKELIKYKGMQVAPAELEAVLLCHPQVADAAVIPLDDEEAGQIPKAYVVLRKDAAAIDPEDIMAFVAARVAPHKKLRALETVEQIPKSASGKILRRVLVARERERAAAR